MHLFHCWHTIHGSERKVKAYRPYRCKHADPYHNVGYYVVVKKRQKCCICDKTRSIVIKVFDVPMALTYKAEED